MEFDYSIVKDPSVFAVNTLPAHSDHVPMAPSDDPSKAGTSLRLSLDGMWKFRYSENYASCPKEFWQADYDVSGWKEIPVPSNIQFEGYDAPAYVNTQYPWDGVEDIKPTKIPEKFDPVGQYVRFFTLPEDWRSSKVHISFQGVESGFAFWLNGKYVGYSEDSFSPSEFDITPFLQDGENRVAVLDFKWTAGSWFEDQDMYRLSGIFRSVYLEKIPEVHLEDVKILTDLVNGFKNGQLEVSLKLTGDTSKASVGWELEKLGVLDSFDALEGKGEVVLSGTCSGKDAAAYRADYREAEERSEGASALHISGKVSKVLAWSAEEPNLYRLNLTIKQDGKVTETVHELCGFRHFEMKDGLMCLNGKRIVFCGVDRHEFSCDTGRSARLKDVIHDVTVMKQNNINAVRTSHYPDASMLYQICDIFGIYLIAENNMETHGSWDALARGQIGRDEVIPGFREEEFEPLLMDRLHSMYELDKNHPAILIWSCGNESWAGSVIWHMSQEFRRLDSTRLVHYEGTVRDRTYPDTTDMETEMYTPQKTIEEYLAEHPEKPFILCEYSHSMGNSNGGLFKYTDYAKKEPRYQGGFIWDFIDQAVRMKNRYGEEYLGYGGDNNERPTDYEFSGNGILDAHRNPYRGKIQEVKFCYQNIDAFVQSSGSAVSVKVVNNNLFVNTDTFDCTAVLKIFGKVRKSIPLATDVAPGETKEYHLPFIIPAAGEYVVAVTFALKEDTIWGKAGDEVAYGEKVLKGACEEEKTLKTPPEDLMLDGKEYTLGGVTVAPVPARPVFEVIEGSINIGVRGTHFFALFSKLKAGLVSYRFGGRELIEKIPRPNFWRAPTNNDEGNQMAARYGVWKLASLYQDFKAPGSNPYMPDDDASSYPKVEKTEQYADIIWKRYFPAPSYEESSFVLTTYRVFPDGTIRLILDWDPECQNKNGKLPPMPEFGWFFALDADFAHVKYYGMGPEENYCDRRKGSRLGVYERDVIDMAEPYLVPQETGNRTGVRCAEITDHKGHGIRFTAAGFEDGRDPEASRPGTMEFSALPYSPEQLEEARHPYELSKPQYTYVRCSLKQMGIAGDDSWGARTHDEFLLPVDRKLSFAVDFKGI